jgi:hypothetical protein
VTIESAVGWIANLLQILLAVFAFWVFWRARQDFRRILISKRRDKTKGSHGVIIVGIPESIRGQVEPVVSQIEAENPKIDIFYTDEIIRHTHLTSAQQVAVLLEILERKRQLTELGVTHVYVFYRGPVALAMGIGALLDNWVPVTVYQFDNSSGSYVPILLLGEGAVLNLRAKLLVESETALFEQVLPNENHLATSSQTAPQK